MPLGEESTKAFVLNYYKLQWERIAYHEDQRMRFSAMVAAGSIAGIGLIARFSKEMDNEATAVACTVVGVANLLAIVFARKSRQWVRYHQEKAEQLSEELEPGITDILKRIDKPNSNIDPFRRELIFTYLHILFIVGASALVWHAYSK